MHLTYVYLRDMIIYDTLRKPSSSFKMNLRSESSKFISYMSTSVKLNIIALIAKSIERSISLSPWVIHQVYSLQKYEASPDYANARVLRAFRVYGSHDGRRRLRQPELVMKMGTRRLIVSRAIGNTCQREHFFLHHPGTRFCKPLNYGRAENWTFMIIYILG